MKLPTFNLTNHRVVILSAYGWTGRDPDYYIQAQCSCGWKGPYRLNSSEASHDLDHHVFTKQSVPLGIIGLIVGFGTFLTGLFLPKLIPVWFGAAVGLCILYYFAEK